MKRTCCVLLILALLVGLVPAFAEEAFNAAPMSADDIKALQIDLIAAGYMEGTADGVMGELTQRAIVAAQEALGLPVNGYADEALTSALVGESFPLQQESQNSLVYRVQLKLYQSGFLEAAPTGYFGSATKEALLNFQEYTSDEAVDYIYGDAQKTYEAMLASAPADVIIDQPILTMACDGVVTQEWYDYIVNAYANPVVNAGLNAQGMEVELLQKRLHALGYLYSGMDGVFGGDTELALKYFQRRNGLAETGACDPATSEVLFSGDAASSDEYVMTHMAMVNRDESRVYIYAWDGDGYDELVQTFVCSCGQRSTPTIEGTFYAIGKAGEWYYMKNSNVWVRYAFQIYGNYFFHSVLFKHEGDKNPTSTSVRKLGKNVSHGCIRLAVEDVKWIYDNCPNNMKVVIV